MLTIGTDMGKPGFYSVSCLCGWKAQKELGKSGLEISPSTSGGTAGWGKRLLYGTPATFLTIWKASRDFYFML